MVPLLGTARSILIRTSAGMLQGISRGRQGETKGTATRLATSAGPISTTSEPESGGEVSPVGLSTILMHLESGRAVCLMARDRGGAMPVHQLVAGGAVGDVADAAGSLSRGLAGAGSGRAQASDGYDPSHVLDGLVPYGTDSYTLSSDDTFGRVLAHQEQQVRALRSVFGGGHEAFVAPAKPV